MLNFIGRGSAFNTAEGNNAAFIKSGSSMLLIDCGSDTFSSIQRLNLLEGVKNIHVLISHTHPDHVGSLGDLIFYAYYALGNQTACVTVHAHDKSSVAEILRLMGVNSNLYRYHGFDDDESFEIRLDDKQIGINVFNSSHVDEIACYSFYLHYEYLTAYYSADANEIEESILDALKDGDIDCFYQDTCGVDYEGNVHLSYSKLLAAIPRECRAEVFCMHIDQAFDEEQAIKDGFNVVQRYGTA